jgi:dTDP-4-dehydrorhamnose reductase
LAGAALAKIEHATTGIHPQTLILRRGHLFGTNFFHNGARDADVISPTYLPDLANAAIDLLLDVEKGIWHLSNAGSVRWSDFRLAVEDALGIRLPGRQESVLTPKMRAITSERGWPMPDWRSALSRFAEHHRSQTNASLQVATGDD